MTGEVDRIRSEIMAVAQRILAANGKPTTIAPETPLADAGLTSMDLVNLMLGVEAAFDLMIPQGDITPDNFRTVAAVQALVTKLQPLSD